MRRVDLGIGVAGLTRAELISTPTPYPLDLKSAVSAIANPDSSSKSVRIRSHCQERVSACLSMEAGVCNGGSHWSHSAAAREARTARFPSRSAI